MYNSEDYNQARRKVRQKKNFYVHLVTYLSCSIFLFVVNMTTSPGHFWFIYPMLGWGIGLASHYTRVFGIPGVGNLDQDWEEREIAKELDKKRYLSDGQLDDGLELPDLRKKRSFDYRNDEFV